MTQGIIVRIVAVDGSAPREEGATMYVGDRTTIGSIGGGRLEWNAIHAARAMTGDTGKVMRQKVALGPGIGQCCGGTVTLEFVKGEAPEVRASHVYIFGGGHVGSALGQILSAMPVAVRVIDSRPGYGEAHPIPEAVIREAKPGSAFVILTHEHAQDFLLVEEALRRGDAAYVGMIGSKTKRAVLQKRLADAGIDPAPLVCPIGASGRTDKKPHAIALHTAMELMEVLKI